MSSLMAVSALLLTLANAASIPSVVLLRRLRIGRAKSLVEIATRFRGGFGRYGVTMAVLHSIRTSHQTNLDGNRVPMKTNRLICPLYPRKRTPRSVRPPVRFISGHIAMSERCPLYPRHSERGRNSRYGPKGTMPIPANGAGAYA